MPTRDFYPYRVHAILARLARAGEAGMTVLDLSNRDAAEANRNRDALRRLGDRVVRVRGAGGEYTYYLNAKGQTRLNYLDEKWGEWQEEQE